MKKVLLLFAVLMASVNLACTEQATGISKCYDGNLTPFAAISVKGTNTGTIASPARHFDCWRCQVFNQNRTAVNAGSYPKSALDNTN